MYGDKNRKKPPKHLRNQVAEDKQLLWEEKAGQEAEMGGASEEYQHITNKAASLECLLKTR